jgi:hypothetical protein
VLEIRYAVFGNAVIHIGTTVYIKICIFFSNILLAIAEDILVVAVRIIYTEKVEVLKQYSCMFSFICC